MKWQPEELERKMGLKRIRRAIRESRYEFTVHALEEMDEDDLDEAEVRQAIVRADAAGEQRPRRLRQHLLQDTVGEFLFRR